MGLALEDFSPPSLGKCLLDTADKVAGMLRRAVRWSSFTVIPGERYMECAYYFDSVGGVFLWKTPSIQ